MSDILVLNGEVMWDSDTVAIVKNDEDIKQQAYLRSTCDLGESAFYSNYGSEIFKYIGKPYSESIKGLIEASAREALLNIKGIKEVISIEFIPFVDKDNNVIDYYITSKYILDDGNVTSSTYNFKI